ICGKCPSACQNGRSLFSGWRNASCESLTRSIFSFLTYGEHLPPRNVLLTFGTTVAHFPSEEFASRWSTATEKPNFYLQRRTYACYALESIWTGNSEPISTNARRDESTL